ncbi:arylsulfatase [Flagellimonas iocasae]|uniref:Arylsulfatase n=1 Tax=Flagellimonas iocasae TaxID=2055905 RepID=A0ABW4Y287_9FLAO
MTRLKYSGALVLATLAFVGCNSKQEQKEQPNERPNIVLIMADDMGYSDLGCYGGEISTPNLDGLAQNGIKFTQFYNAARCCPTRASLMTGVYPSEAGIGHMTGSNQGPGYLGVLNDSVVTIPQVLSEVGYSTGMSGKWHAGTERESWPENRGFQNTYVIHNWIDSYFKVLETCEIYENGKIIIPATSNPGEYEPQPNNKEWYTTDVFTTKAIEHIDKALEEKKPFFEYVAYNAPHWPLEAHDDVIAKYKDKYSGGYEALRLEKYQKMKEMGLVSEDWDLPEQDTPEWASLPDTVQQDLKFMRAIYAAQIDIMDKNIGRIVDHLKEKGALDNTLILFLSDNGCSAEPMGEDYGWKWGTNTSRNYEDWRKNSAREGASQGRVWTVTSNTPFRKFKRFTHEGGISTPLIAHWPKGIVKSGIMDAEPGHLVDIMATCLDISGATYPETYNGKPILSKRGISLGDNFKGKDEQKHDVIFWEHEGHAAIRKGDWKLVTVDPSDETLWELYNIVNDRTETHDLATQKPEMVAELKGLWEKMAFETKAWPKPSGENSIPNRIDYEDPDNLTGRAE